MMVKTHIVFPFLSMPFAMEERTFFSDKRGSLFSLSFFGSYASKSELTYFFFGFFAAYMLTVRIFVSVCKVFFRSDPFKVIGFIISLISVLMMYVFAIIWILNPACSNNSMNEKFTQAKITIAQLCRNTRSHPSKNFSAARSRIDVVENSIFDAFHIKDDHVDSPLDDMRLHSTKNQRKLKHG